MPRLSTDEIRNIIHNIKIQIEDSLGETVRIEDSPKGRKGSRLYVNLRKKGVSSLEVISSVNGSLSMGIAIPYQDEKAVETATLIKSIMKIKGYKLIEDQKNPRYEYSLNTFIDAYTFLSNHEALEDIEKLRLSKKLFEYDYSPLKIVKRYEFAINQEDQSMLDLCRNLLDADVFDSFISLNRRTDDKCYREHVVPCVLIHNRVIEMLLNKYDHTEIARLIETHLKIAHIKKIDAHKLDFELGLRTSMPIGWEWGDDILARLKLADILL